jgi:Secreted and surface protein containing fasciclin-like repeats
MNFFRRSVTSSHMILILPAAVLLLLAEIASFASAQQSIYELANQTEALSTLKAAIDAAGLADALSGNGTFTVFAPTNEAFGKIDSATMDKLLKPEWSHHLEDVLFYHVLPSVVTSSDLVDGSVVTLNEESITINATALNINNSSGIVADSVDIQASNGVVRKCNFLTSLLGKTCPCSTAVINCCKLTTIFCSSLASCSSCSFSSDLIDSVLLPTSVTSNIVEVASTKPHLTTLVELVVAAELAETLSAAGPFTVFAPNDAAFAALPAAELEDLKKEENKDMLANVLQYHVVRRNRYLEDFTASHYHLDTLNGEEIHIDVGAHDDHRKLAEDDHGHDEDEVTVNGAHIIRTFYGNNGVIHVVDKVLEDDHSHSSGASSMKMFIGATLALLGASIML